MSGRGREFVTSCSPIQFKCLNLIMIIGRLVSMKDGWMDGWNDVAI